ncbi:MAG: hypothetical protein JWR90_2930 [Marmoricola sp.]|nr:hypothetical protein [Marmoricola sp.]
MTTSDGNEAGMTAFDNGLSVTQGVHVWFPVQPGQVVVEADRPAEHWILEFIGAFSMVQDQVEFAVFMRIRSESPRLAKTLQEKYLTRINDTDRWEYVKALAKDVGYEGDINRASDTFKACQRLRNLVAHSNQLDLVREHGTSDYFYQLPPGVTPRGVPTPLTPAVFRQFAANCRWLRALIVHLESLGGTKFVLPVGIERADGSLYSPRIEMLAPPPLPVPPDWAPSPESYHELPEDEGLEA